tara:strand:+ start:328 stop:474 length:147 start_codon:yes stop_codon:yes gene_type:complete
MRKGAMPMSEDCNIPPEIGSDKEEKKGKEVKELIHYEEQFGNLYKQSP